MLFLGIALALLTGLYCAHVWMFVLGLGRLSRGQNSTTPPVSVVVAARNEEAHIGACLRSLLDQTYAQALDIVVADDGSTDQTAQVVTGIARDHPQVNLIHVASTPPGWAPKKYALDQAIAHSRGDIILTTDADCLLPPTWVTGMIRHFEPAVGMVAGLIRLQPFDGKRGLWFRLQDLELLSLFLVAAGGMDRNIILTASGGNLAYRRQAFMDAGGFDVIRGLVSGDDDLLLQQMASRTDWQRHFCIDPQTVVTTKSHSNLTDFFRQRQRWASKAVHQRPHNFFFLLVTFLFNLSLLMAVPVAVLWPRGLTVLLVSLAAKIFSELALLWKGARLLDRTEALLIFPLWELLHIPYVVISGFSGLSRNLRWKSRQFRGQTGPLGKTEP